jgi:formylglycine-generating enzyme required for sulfatase activity/alpha-tubulin suppressor-like RCC1 family protein
LADPATVSGFRLDKYLITVGRFRQYVSYLVGGGSPPASGSGKHEHLSGGQGLVNSGDDAGVAYEMGWDATAWSQYIPTGSNAPSAWTNNLTACASAGAPITWTTSAGSNENLPITCIDWYDAYAFCIWDGGFLPSEAEWEYAAAGGSEQREYPWGSTAPGTGNQYAIYGSYYPNGSGNCTGIANFAPVGTTTLGAGLWGQLDMLGEVYEWNVDSYATYVDPCVDCANLSSAAAQVVRSVGAEGTGATSWTRSNVPPMYRGGGIKIGARCARTSSGGGTNSTSSSSSGGGPTDGGGADGTSSSGTPDSRGTGDTGGAGTGDAARHSTATAVSIGLVSACAVTAGGGVECWGDNQAGELGNGSTTGSLVPVQVTGLTSGVTAVSVGYDSVCALTTGGGVECWGTDSLGTLGNNSTTNSSVPVQVMGLTSGVSVVSTGLGSTCAVTAGGGVQCWGANNFGHLGNNSTTGSLVPVQVSGLTSGASVVSMGWRSACALTAGGAVQCWGDNTYGELGNGSTTSSLVPVQVTGLTSGVTVVSVGTGTFPANGNAGAFACALTAGGAVQCWGYNQSGELGNGSTTSSLVPVQVTGLTSGVTAISAGAVSTCAITAGGGVECWGGNNGLLGNGTTMNSLIPVQVTGLTSGVAAISVWNASACAVTAGGGVECWGANPSGELGNGSTTNSLVPVPVTGF